MATWVTHLMVADGVIKKIPLLCRHEFFVGNIAPDCNVETEDWTSFTPPRELTHWMGYMPKKEVSRYPYIAMSQEEYSFFVKSATELVVEAIEKYMEEHGS